jgi:transposase
MNKRNDLEAYTIEDSVDSDVVVHVFNAFSHTIQSPRGVLVDNGSVHTSEAFQEEIPKREKQGLSIFYLPEYSPELNLIEFDQDYIRVTIRRLTCNFFYLYLNDY